MGRTQGQSEGRPGDRVKAFTEIDVPQGSEEWLQARVGLLTGSVAHDVLAVVKTGEAAARRDLRMRLVVERITGQSCDEPFTSRDVERGKALEGEARMAYEAHTGAMVRTSGFLCATDYPIGVSLDGHVGDYDGIIECKCPRAANHFEIIRAGGLPKKYLAQLLHGLFVTGAQWADFVSYCPQFPSDLQLYVYRLERDEAQIADYARKVIEFLGEVDAEQASVEKLRKMRAA